MADSYGVGARSLFQEARVETLKAHMLGLFTAGRHNDLRDVFTHNLRHPGLSRGGFLVASYRDFSLFSIALFKGVDENIAIQLVQLALPLYSGASIEEGEQLEGLLVDLYRHWAWITSDIGNVELFPREFQCMICTALPEMIDDMMILPTNLASIDSERPFRSAIWFMQASHQEKVVGLSGITDAETARVIARIGGGADLIRECNNPLVAEAYLSHCLL